MFEKIVYPLKQAAKPVVLICCGLASVLYFILAIGGMVGQDNAGVIIAEFVSAVAYIAFCAILAFAIWKKKTAEARIIGGLLLGYFFVDYTFTLSNGFWVSTAVGIFDLLLGCCLLAIIVFFVMGLFKPETKNNESIKWAIVGCLGGYALFSLVDFILRIVAGAQNGAGWLWYINLVLDLVMVAFVLFGTIALLIEVDEPAPQEIKAEEEPVEEVQQEPAEEPQEEAAPEETKEEPQEEPAPEEEAPKE